MRVMEGFFSHENQWIWILSRRETELLPLLHGRSFCWRAAPKTNVRFEWETRGGGGGGAAGVPTAGAGIVTLSTLHLGGGHVGGAPLTPRQRGRSGQHVRPGRFCLLLKQPPLDVSSKKQTVFDASKPK